MFLEKKSEVVGAIEDTAYTPDDLVDADFDLEVEDISYSQEIKEFQRKVADGTLDSYNSVMGKQSGKISFMTPMNPGAAVNTEPKWSKYLRACGYKKTAHGVTGISWVPHTDCTHVPMTLEVVEIKEGASPKQLVTRLGGAMGNVTIGVGEVGEPIQLKFEFTGKLIGVVDRPFASLLTPTSVNTEQPPALMGATVTVGGVTQVFNNFEVNTGNSINLWTDPSKSEGIKGAYIGSRETVLTMDPILELLADDPVYTDWLAGNTGAVSIVMGSTPELTLSAPAAQYSTVGMGARDEARTAEKTFRLHRDVSGETYNDSFEILQGAKA